jgi:cold-inducible RNA-binding protein
MNRMNIYVGNLPFDATKDQVNDLFARFGEVESVRIISDRVTGSPRGFAFVQMTKEEGQRAIAELNNTDFLGKQIRVNEARPREEGAAPRRSYNNGGSNGSSNGGGYNKRRF